MTGGVVEAEDDRSLPRSHCLDRAEGKGSTPLRAQATPTDDDLVGVVGVPLVADVVEPADLVPSEVAVGVVRVRRRSGRAFAVTALGPTIVVASVLWALLQPYRLTLLHPDGRSFWSLAIESPLLAVFVGVFFHAFVTPGLLRDLNRPG